MRVVFLDLFTMLSIALFVLFAVSIGEQSRDERAKGLVILEIRSSLETWGGSKAQSLSLTDYDVKLVEGVIQDTSNFRKQKIVGKDYIQFIFEGLSETVDVEIYTSRIDGRAFGYATNQLQMSVVYPYTETITVPPHSIGSAIDVILRLNP